MVRDITTTYRMEHRRKEYQKIAEWYRDKIKSFESTEITAPKAQLGTLKFIVRYDYYYGCGQCVMRFAKTMISSDFVALTPR
jgi:hypothetical protein